MSSKGGSLFDLGPTLYNKQVFSRVFGREYSSCEGETSKARELIESSDGVIISKKEAACDDGLLVDNTLPKCHDRGSLYAKYNMEPWAPQVDARWRKDEE